MIEKNIIKLFPSLKIGQFAITSPFDKKYNCIAWAAGDTTRWWEPDTMGFYYWPEHVPREYTINAYEEIFKNFGFSECDTVDHEDDFTKIALFAKRDRPTHAARQISSIFWTSKIGQNVDIEHKLYDICGNEYGDVIKILKRPRHLDKV